MQTLNSKPETGTGMGVGAAECERGGGVRQEITVSEMDFKLDSQHHILLFLTATQQAMQSERSEPLFIPTSFNNHPAVNRLEQSSETGIGSMKRIGNTFCGFLCGAL